jgi:FixJ family two-component response regulator
MEMNTAHSYLREAAIADRMNTIPRRSIDTGTNPDLSIVFVAKDDVSLRDALQLLIKPPAWQLETIASPEDILSRPLVAVPCCLMLDVTRRGRAGLDTQRRLAPRTELPIIFVAEHADVPLIVQAMKAGAAEFLIKPLKSEAVLTALREAIERSRAALLAAAELGVLRSRYASLTARERDVMGSVICGLLNKQVAAELGISEVTVKRHRGRVMRKMSAASLPDLVTIGARLGLQSSRRPS